jgi:hypothetical protein
MGKLNFMRFGSIGAKGYAMWGPHPTGLCYEDVCCLALLRKSFWKRGGKVLYHSGRQMKNKKFKKI